MDKRVTLYERELLYPTGENNDPGSVNVKVFSPTKQGYIPIIIENRSYHLIREYIYLIIEIVQKDIFDRVNIDIKRNAVVVIKNNTQDKIEYLKIIFEEDSIQFTNIKNLEEFLD
ncbi:MAG: hypothetical protein ABF289_07885 [Clostridiales bacterium]